MTQNRLTFESQSLIVDWISFNISVGANFDRNRMAEYFLNLGFNSSQRINQGKMEFLFWDEKNVHQVLFWKKTYNPVNKSYWNGTSVIFNGENASHFYEMVRMELIDWTIFDFKFTELGRLDIKYTIQTDLINDVKYFLKRSFHFLESLPRKRVLEFDPKKNKKEDLILRICRRDSPMHYRIYFRDNKLNFELEFKKNKVKSFQKFLSQNRIKEFEQIITESYFKRWSHLLPIKEGLSYTNWILKFQRTQNNKITHNKNALVTNYFNLEELSFTSDLDYFYTLLQFFSYLRIKKFAILDVTLLDDKIFYKIEFYLQDFLHFIGQDSYYQLNQKRQILNHFFDNLCTIQLKTFISSYYEQQFKSLAVFPSYKIAKKNKHITVSLYMVKDFYNYSYPFTFNSFFLTYQNKYELIVKLQVIEAFSSPSLFKILDIQKILYQNQRSHKQIKQISQTIINVLNFMIENTMIENNIMKIYVDRPYVKIEQPFSLESIYKTDKIAFTEIIHRKK